MVILRRIGLWLFLLALVALAVDSMKSLAADEVIITSLGEHWYELSSKSLKGFQIFIETYTHPFLWDPILFQILNWPAWVVLGFLGCLIYWLGRKRKATSIYIN